MPRSVRATAPLPILGKGMVERALKKRRHKPIFMVDIAVPRDIEPEVADLQDVYLYTVDDLHSVIDDNMRSRQEAAREAEIIVTACAQQFMHHKREQGALSIMTVYRQQADVVREQELAKAMSALKKGDDPAAVLERLSRQLMNKMLHAPTIAMKKAAAAGEQDKLDWADKIGTKAYVKTKGPVYSGTTITGKFSSRTLRETMRAVRIHETVAPDTPEGWEIRLS